VWNVIYKMTKYIIFVLTILISPLLSDKLSLLYQQQIESAKISQQTINNLDDKTKRLLYEYERVFQENEIIEKYNKDLEKIITQLKKDIDKTDKTIDTMQQNEKSLLPMLTNMLQTLKAFVKDDLPFLQKERLGVIENTQNMIYSSISFEKKFEMVINLYQQELDYNYQINLYQIDNKKEIYNIIQVGRVVLYKFFNNQKCSIYKDKTFKSLNSCKFLESIVKKLKSKEPLGLVELNGISK